MGAAHRILQNKSVLLVLCKAHLLALLPMAPFSRGVLFVVELPNERITALDQLCHTVVTRYYVVERDGLHRLQELLWEFLTSNHLSGNNDSEDACRSYAV